MSINPSNTKSNQIPLKINTNTDVYNKNCSKNKHSNINYDHQYTKRDVQNPSIQAPQLRPTVSLINPLANTPNKQQAPKSAPVTPSTYHYPYHHQQAMNTNPIFYIQSSHKKNNEHSTSLPTQSLSNLNIKSSPQSLPCTPIATKAKIIQRKSDENMTESPLTVNTTKRKIEIINRKTIIIFDWDDTLLPSHFLQINGLRAKSKPPKGINPRTTPLNQAEKTKILLGLRKLEHVITNLLFTAIQCVGIGNVIIITNAEQGWVEMSCCNFLPNVTKILRNCRIISARSTFEAQYPSSAIEWKRRAIKLVIDQICQTNVDIDKISAFKSEVTETKEDEEILNDVTKIINQVNMEKDVMIENLHVISFGDSMVERQAVFDVCKCINFEKNKIKNVITKSIKLLVSPSINQLIDELQTIQKSFSSIISHNNHLDYQVQVN